jgi:hypothetical protein
MCYQIEHTGIVTELKIQKVKSLPTTRHLESKIQECAFLSVQYHIVGVIEWVWKKE